MIRQAHTYLAGAVSGTALIAAAVVGFVMLVSLQALKDWPLAGLGGDSAAVSARQPVGTAGPAANTVAGRRAAVGAAGKRRHGSGPQHGGANSLDGRHGVAGDTSLTPSGGEPPSSSSTGSAGSSPSSAPGGGGSVSGSGGGGGSGQSASGTVTGAVDKTVSGVDQATGGTLGNTGVTKVTEETVNGVGGPESPVGEAVDKAAKSVGGLLGGGH